MGLLGGGTAAPYLSSAKYVGPMVRVNGIDCSELNFQPVKVLGTGIGLLQTLLTSPGFLGKGIGLFFTNFGYLHS